MELELGEFIINFKIKKNYYICRMKINLLEPLIGDFLFTIDKRKIKSKCILVFNNKVPIEEIIKILNSGIFEYDYETKSEDIQPKEPTK